MKKKPRLISMDALHAICKSLGADMKGQRPYERGYRAALADVAALASAQAVGRSPDAGEA